jgi:hypothetical protein
VSSLDPRISGLRASNFRSRAGDFRCWSFVMRRVLSASNFRFRADNSGYLSRSWEIYFGSWSGSFRRRSRNFWSRAGNLRCPGRTSGIGQGVQMLLKEIQVLKMHFRSRSGRLRCRPSNFGYRADSFRRIRNRADYSRCRARKYRYRASKIPGIGQGIFS